MTQHQAEALKASLREAFTQTINEIGLKAFQATSWFGSNDPAFKATHWVKKAA